MEVQRFSTRPRKLERKGGGSGVRHAPGKTAMVRFFCRRLKEKARTSLWLLPTVAAGNALFVARALPAVERRLYDTRGAWYLFAGEPESARELLATIASSMMTFMALVFSITILVLQLASSQFSPRVLQTFLEDGATRSAIATFVGTFVYAMALLPEVRSEGAAGGRHLPALAVFLAFVLVIVSVAVFIRYMHRMAHSIRSVHVVRRVAQDGAVNLEDLYPEGASSEPEDDAEVRPPASRPSQLVRHGDEGGVVVAVDDAALLEIAIEHDAVIALVPYPGDFVVRRGPLLRVWSGCPIDEGALRRTIAFAEERTPQEDLAFALRQLVDIAERALSPAVNDPTTAVQALDRIADLMTALATRRFPSPNRLDAGGRLRLILPRPSWDDLVHLAFDEIRHCGRGSIQVLRRMRAALEGIAPLCSESRRAVVLAELDDLNRLARAFPPPDRDLARSPSAQGHGATSESSRRGLPPRRGASRGR